MSTPSRILFVSEKPYDKKLEPHFIVAQFTPIVSYDQALFNRPVAKLAETVNYVWLPISDRKARKYLEKNIKELFRLYKPVVITHFTKRQKFIKDLARHTEDGLLVCSIKKLKQGELRSLTTGELLEHLEENMVRISKPVTGILSRLFCCRVSKKKAEKSEE